MKNNKQKKWISVILLFLLLCASGSRRIISAEDWTAPVFDITDGSSVAAENADIFGDGFTDFFSETEPEAPIPDLDIPKDEEEASETERGELLIEFEYPADAEFADGMSEADGQTKQKEINGSAETPFDTDTVFQEGEEPSQSGEDTQEYGENETSQDMEVLDSSYGPMEEPLEAENSEQIRVYGELVANFLGLTEEEQLALVQAMDAAPFFELLEVLVEEGILASGEDGFTLASSADSVRTEAVSEEGQVPSENSEQSEQPLLSERVLRAFTEKWLLLSGSVMTMAINKNIFSPSENVLISGNTITLQGDVTMNNQMQINNGDDITIDLNGHVLEMANNGCYFMIGPGGILTMDDTAGGGIVYNKTQLVWLYNGGTFNLNNGTIDGSKITSQAQQGGAVYLGSPMNGDEVFNMYGGTIRNCHSSQYGGAVYVAAPSSGHHCFFNMYGGSILNCYSGSGGAIYVGSQGADRSTVHLEGRSKITLLGNSCTGNGRGGAIYSDGKVEISGILDIGHGKVSETHCDSVYIDKNNWSGYVPEYLDVTGRLVVVGDGYIDLDTNYPAANAVVQGHTVVKNSAGLTPQEFYTYGAYFINSTRGLTVSAGFDPEKNATTSETGPKNWHTYNSDTGNFEKQTYVDVMGQTMYVEATSEPGKRQYQDWNYLIYTERSQPSDPILEFFAVKIVKRASDTKELLNGAQFALTGTVYDVYGTETEEKVTGVSGLTGAAQTGASQGETYIYTDNQYNQKLMLRDGVYTITETKAPDGGYKPRENFVTIKVHHENSGEVSIVVVEANGIKLQQVTNSDISSDSQYGDQGHLIEHEVVLEVENSKDVPVPELPEYTLKAEKYGDASYIRPLSGAVFELQQDGVALVSGTADEAGKVGFIDAKTGENYQITANCSLQLVETKAPEGRKPISPIAISTDADGKLMIGGVELAEGGTISSVTEGSDVESVGSWEISRTGTEITVKVYDPEIPKIVWKLDAVKYGTASVPENTLGGAVFLLYEEKHPDTPMGRAVSSSGADSSGRGQLQFENEQGEEITLSQGNTYILTEETAPQGYTKADDFRITVSEDGLSASVTQNGQVVSSDGTGHRITIDTDSRVISMAIVDNAVYVLPESGGMGIYPLVLLSILMMTGTMAVWLSLRKKKTIG